MEHQKLIKRKKTLTAIMIVPGILLAIIALYILTYKGDQDLIALYAMVPLIAFTGLIFPFIQILKIQKELKKIP
ncbi:hypothetical protein [Aquiflexum sp.]|uniref:hypothetical protein n=1 Tax=Aquiflexum sp. TaxID=1872584 RepID=UPI0035934486